MAKSASPPVVLIVDDEKESRLIFSLLLEDVGFTVDRADNGIEALAVIELRTPSLIVTDLRMPLMNGIELAMSLKGHPQWKKIPIFLVSRAPPWLAFELALFAQVFTKPLPIEILVNRINALFH